MDARQVHAVGLGLQDDSAVFEQPPELELGRGGQADGLPRERGEIYELRRTAAVQNLEKIDRRLVVAERPTERRAAQ